MLKPICSPCHRFFRMVKSGFYFIEGMPIGNNIPAGMVEPGYVVTPWPRKKTVCDVRDIRGLVAESNKYV